MSELRVVRLVGTNERNVHIKVRHRDLMKNPTKLGAIKY